MSRRLAVLGSTGSVGCSTLDIVRQHPDRFEVVALTASTNVDKLAEQARSVGARRAVIADERKYAALKDALAGSTCEPAAGREALNEAAARDTELVMAAIVGCAGLEPAIAAIEAGATLALANKEAMVAAGTLMTEAARRSGSVILPVDSEHNAIFQCLAGQGCGPVSRLILTASGGPFRTWQSSAMAAATPEQAVAHPNWSMGAKISVDSATMMNKGLELIEAHHLFGVESQRIDILVHPQSIVHSMVEFVDGSVIAQMGSPDMRIPIAFALAYPERVTTGAERVDFVAAGSLDFDAPDETRFPALRIAREALAQGGAAPIVLNAANEVAVAAFLRGGIGFGEIVETVERALAEHNGGAPASIAEVIDIDQSTRARVSRLIPGEVAA